MAEQRFNEKILDFRTMGSAAYDIHAPERSRVQLPEERTVSGPVRREQAKVHISPFAVLGILAAAFLAALVIFCYVRIYEVNSSIASLKTQLNELEETHMRLEGRYQSQLDLLDLEAHARQHGLSNPTQSQIVYLDLSGADHADITPAAEQNEFAVFLSSVIQSVREFVEYLS